MSRGLRGLWLPLLWALTAALMIRNHLADPWTPGLEGTAAYGHNHQGALVQGLAATLVELAVMTLILRPWSPIRSWIRPLIALLLLLPWTAFSMILTMHTGGIVALHFLWLVILVLAAACSALWNGLRAP